MFAVFVMKFCFDPFHLGQWKTRKDFCYFCSSIWVWKQKNLHCNVILNSLVLCSVLYKISHFMVKNPDLSSVFLQGSRKPCLLLNSNCILVIVLLFWIFLITHMLFIASGLKVFKSNSWPKSSEKGCSSNLGNEKHFCVIVISANPKYIKKILKLFLCPMQVT